MARLGATGGLLSQIRYPRLASGNELRSSLALGLEFQLASDVLRTAISPSFQQLAQLAAVATIRTALNFFLAREIREEQRIVQEAGEHPADVVPETVR